MKPRVSVIIPCYNTQDYIERAIDSVLHQSERNTEVLAINDGSTDGTLEKILSFNDERVVCIDLNENRGPSYARNKGLQKASGEWIAFLDSDDWFSEDRIRSLVDYATDTHADMAIDDSFLIRDGHRYPWNTEFKKLRYSPVKDMPLSPEIFLNLNIGMKPIVRSSFLDRNGIVFDSDFKGVEDFVFYLGCLLAGAKCVVLNEPHYYYFQRPGSLVGRGVVQLKQFLEAINKVESQLNPIQVSVKAALCERRKKVLDELSFQEVMELIQRRQWSRIPNALRSNSRFGVQVMRRILNAYRYRRSLRQKYAV